MKITTTTRAGRPRATPPPPTNQPPLPRQLSAAGRSPAVGFGGLSLGFYHAGISFHKRTHILGMKEHKVQKSFFQLQFKICFISVQTPVLCVSGRGPRISARDARARCWSRQREQIHLTTIPQFRCERVFFLRRREQSCHMEGGRKSFI